MEMNQIRYFLAVYKHRNFTHAAQASNVSQPSLTASIKKLEDELGGVLFLRDRAGCRLTPLGKLIYPRLEKIHYETNEAKQEAIRHTRLDRVPISIGIAETIGKSKICDAIENYRIKLPSIDIELVIDTHSILVERLKEGTHDFIITSTEVNPDLFRKELLYREEYQAVISSQHPLSQYKTVSLEQLSNTIMLDRPNCEMRDNLHETCSQNGYTLYANYRSNRVDWLLELARKGSGAVILPTTEIPLEEGLISLKIDDVNIEREVFAIRYHHHALRPEADTLVKQLAVLK